MNNYELDYNIIYDKITFQNNLPQAEMFKPYGSPSLIATALSSSDEKFQYILLFYAFIIVYTLITHSLLHILC